MRAGHAHLRVSEYRTPRLRSRQLHSRILPRRLEQHTRSNLVDVHRHRRPRPMSHCHQAMFHQSRFAHG